MVRPGEELTLGAMRRAGVRGVTICCTACGHLAKLVPDDWPDEAQLADLQQRFVCQSCGHKGADIEPDFDWDKQGRPSG